MARLRLEQVKANMHFDETSNTLMVSGSQQVTGSVYVSGSSSATGSLTINGYDTFGDDTNPNTIDLGTF